MNPVIRYLHNTETYSTARYIVEMTAVGYGLKILSSVIFFALIFSTTGQDITDQMDQPVFGSFLIISAVLIAPILETIVGQMIPIWFTSLFTKNTYLPIIVSSLFFTILHPFPSFGAILPIAFIFAWTYSIKQKVSHWHAYWITTAIHALHNGIALLFIM